MMVDGKAYSATFTTDDEAREWLVVTRGRVVGARAARRVTVEQYASRWLGEFIDTAAGIDRYRRDVVQHILPVLGPRPLAEVTPTEIAALLEQVAVSPVEAVQLQVTLREVFDDAADGGMIARSPVPASRRATSGSVAP